MSKGMPKGTRLKKKICNECGFEKAINQFQKSATTKGGYINKCKRCRNNRQNALNAGKNTPWTASPNASLGIMIFNSNKL